MLTQELTVRLSEIDTEIDKLETEIAPIKARLDRLLESRRHIQRLLELENGASPKSPVVPLSVPRKKGGDVYWQALCDQYRYDVGGDSAHRVFRRQNPALHVSIEHYCEIDKRTYP